MSKGSDEAGRLANRLFISRSYALLWAAQALSSFAEYFVAATATVWIVAGLGTGNAATPRFVALVIAAVALPRLLIAPFAGVWADRWNPRRVMILSDLARAAIYLGVLASAGLQAETAVVVLVIAQFGASVSSQFFDPARNAMMQLVIPERRRSEAAGRSMFATMGVGILATVSGPAVFAVSGPAIALGVSVLCLLISSALVRCVPAAVPLCESGGVRYWRSLRDGLAIAWRISGVRLLLIGMGIYGLSLGVNNVALSLFALDTMGLSPAEYGAVSGMFSVGGLIGAVIAPLIVSRLGAERLFPFALVLLGVTYIGYSFVRAFLPAMVVMGTAGLMFSLYVVCQGPILQACVPVGAMGRVSALVAPILTACSLLATGIASQVFVSLGSADLRAAAYAGAISVSAAVLTIASLILVVGQRLAKRSQPPAG